MLNEFVHVNKVFLRAFFETKKAKKILDILME